VTEQISVKKARTFSDYLRIWFKGILDAVGRFLNRIGVLPNTMTFMGLLGNVVGAYFLARGEIVIGGIIVLVMGPVDALDGTMARLRGEPSSFGGFIDSVSDRYSELVIYLGLLIYSLNTGDHIMSALVYMAASGSVLVSYVKSRAETLGFECKIGLLSRVERYLVLAPLLVLNRPIWALWIIAILANFTALQRFLYVRNQARQQHKL
jgi:CDP-diacylglycerol--glycerol-3-phosphate 3-phosphatidyltransferase